MPKQKTHSGAKKRFKKSASGRIKFRAAGSSHNFTKDSAKKKRQRHSPGQYLAPCDEKAVNRMLCEE